MRARSMSAALLALAALLVLGTGALAGGWAAAIVKDQPTPRAGEAATIDMTLLQHGKWPALGAMVTVRAVERETGQIASAVAVEDTTSSEPGDYSATLTFPIDGTWDWTIHMEWLEVTTVLRPLIVTPASAPPAAAPQAPAEPASAGQPAAAAPVPAAPESQGVAVSATLVLGAIVGGAVLLLVVGLALAGRRSGTIVQA